MKEYTALIVQAPSEKTEPLLQLLHLQKIKAISVDSLDAAHSYLRSNQIHVIFAPSKAQKEFARYPIPCQEFTKNALDQFLSQLNKKKQPPIIAESPQMKELFKKAAKIAQSEASVFITGESGTGKEVLAHFIHTNSKRATNPFIQVNCAAIPETLLESEFFGHVRGAFTGALSDRTGRFEVANTGTLLLDEVSEIPLSLQAKLLRAIQEQSFEKIGSNNSLSVSVRFIATSNRDMEDALERGEFREDLFYRLGVVPLYIPPLRERVEDLVPLAEHFLAIACKKNHLPPKKLSQRALSILQKYRWPGNVRELSNVIEHAAVLCDNEIIEVSDLPLSDTTSSLQTAYPFMHLSMKEVEQIHIRYILRKCNNNKTKAAAILKISLRTLRNKLNN